MTGLRDEFGDEFNRVSGDVRNSLIDKAGVEANDKIKMVPEGQVVVAYGGMYGRFTDVSGLGLAEHARRLIHPDPLKKD